MLVFFILFTFTTIISLFYIFLLSLSFACLDNDLYINYFFYLILYMNYNYIRGDNNDCKYLYCQFSSSIKEIFVI